MISYRKTKTLDERITESNKILAKYPFSIPVIVETNDPIIKKNIKKYKFLVPHNVNATHLIYSIRRQFDLSSNKAIFLYCDNILISGITMMAEIYEKYKERNQNSKDYDKFLYITISTENTFG
jgi:hypothetical protein